MPPPLDEQIRTVIAERDKLKVDLSEKTAALSKLRTENDRLLKRVGEQEMELSELRANPPTTITLKDPRENDTWVDPKSVRYDKDGYNSWGTKYVVTCGQCGSATPSNMLGMATCLNCGHINRPGTY